MNPTPTGLTFGEPNMKTLNLHVGHLHENERHYFLYSQDNAGFRIGAINSNHDNHHRECG